MWKELFSEVKSGNVKSLARCISLIENEYEGYEELLRMIPAGGAKITGITGPPGAGKSTLVDALIAQLVKAGKKVGILCIDPSSPFNYGALLGDRIRMSNWYTNDSVYIRSMATRGSMGGLHPKIIEVTDLYRAFGFDHIIIETVGVGQSEIEIAGLADVTVVVLVPEAGDEVQTMKAGLMEIADIFVVNKSDRPDADEFMRNLRLMLAPSFTKHYNEVPVVKTIASTGEGIPELQTLILHQLQKAHVSDKTFWLLAEKAYHLVQQKKMKQFNKATLKAEIEELYRLGSFNLYQYVAEK